MGNIHVALPPSEGVDGVPIFLNAHLDTVPPTGPIDPEVRNGVVVNRHDTILGADNKAAVVVMLAAVADLVRTGRPHAGVELVLTPMEEVGLQGRQGLRHLAAPGDGSATATTTPPRSGTWSSPRPPSGRCGFASSAAPPTPGSPRRRDEARSSRRPGRSPTCRSGGSTPRRPRTSASSPAGIAGNIVPPECLVESEARSRDPGRLREQVQAMLDAATFAANLAECELESRIEPEYDGYRFSRSDPAVRLAARALEACGREPVYIDSGGGADANVWNARGLECVNLCNGMAEIHTASEHIAASDLDVDARHHPRVDRRRPDPVQPVESAEA